MLKNLNIISIYEVLIKFLDRKITMFGQWTQNIIGLIITILLVTILLHLAIGPTYIEGKIFFKNTATGYKSFTQDYVIEYNDRIIYPNAYGSWMIPVQGGLPRKITLRILDSIHINKKSIIGETSFVGPIPLVNSIDPHCFNITILPGNKIETASVSIDEEIISYLSALTRKVFKSNNLYAQQVIYPKVIVELQNCGSVLFNNGGWCGTKGEERRLEGFQLWIDPPITGLSIRYRGHVQGQGDDLNWTMENNFCGTRGQGKRLEGFWIELTGPESSKYSIKYQAHLEGSGDTDVYHDGQFAGTKGQSRRIEAIKVWIEPKN